MADPTILKHFASFDDARSYAESELIATLEDDLHRQENEERQHYTDEDREDMRNRIHDLRLLFGFDTTTDDIEEEED